MKKALMVPIAVALVIAAPHGLAAQESPSKRSPVVAGAMSGVIWPGIGSFYAGDSGHGIRHTAIAGLSLLGVVAGMSNCDIISFGGPSESDGCAIAGVSAIAFAGNWVWSIVVGVNDAKAHNRSLELAPRLVAFDSSEGKPVLGVELLRFGL